MSKITHDELTAMFPHGMPMALMKVLFPEKSEHLTTEEAREVCAAFSRQQPHRDPIGYRSIMELMHRGMKEVRENAMSERAKALFSLCSELEREFPEAHALIEERWGAGRNAMKEGA